MKRIFIDTNIMLDLLGERIPFYEEAAQLVTQADLKKIVLVVSPISFATVNYFLVKFQNALIAKEKLRKFKIICEVCAFHDSIIDKALNSNFNDFEDALQYYSAVDAGCEIIITRNGKDFKNSLLPVMTANEYLKSFQL